MNFLKCSYVLSKEQCFYCECFRTFLKEWQIFEEFLQEESFVSSSFLLSASNHWHFQKNWKKLSGSSSQWIVKGSESWLSSQTFKVRKKLFEVMTYFKHSLLQMMKIRSYLIEVAIECKGSLRLFEFFLRSFFTLELMHSYFVCFKIVTQTLTI